ncbi:MAG: class B sortase [Lachnospiraceae bacterium]
MKEKKISKGNAAAVFREEEIRQNYRVSKKEFSGQKNYEAALRDQDKIVSVLTGVDWDNYDHIATLEKKLRQGISFETSLGKRFDDAVFEQYHNLKKNLVDVNQGRRRREDSAKNSIGLTKDSMNRLKAQEFTKEDEKIEYYAKLELKKREQRRRLITISVSLLGVFCITYFALYYYRVQKSEDRVAQLSELIGSEALNGNAEQEEQNTSIHLTEDEEAELQVLPKYQTLYNSNRSLIGWIKIDDTIIDYPVMQCGDNTYYLSHNFDQQEDRAGSLFLDCNCDIVHENDNYIIYGHHMSSGKMFAGLEEYEKETYYESHPYIQFDTIYREQTYQVMYVFRSRVYNEEDVRFKYYQFIDANSETEFQSYMNEMAQLSFYDTGVTASYGDQLLTLSTCDYNESNGRFVVVAKRIR